MPTTGEIKNDDVLLIDFWAKVANDPRAVYYDATWMAYCGRDVPARVREVWEVVKGARDAAVAFVQESVAAGRTIHGFEVDDVSRGHVEARGFGPYFLHRTGHSIGYEVHGNGVNIDNLETRDQRRIVPGVCFSIEPGVYLPEFGVRSEIDMFVGEGRAEVTGGHPAGAAAPRLAGEEKGEGPHRAAETVVAGAVLPERAAKLPPSLAVTQGAARASIGPLWPATPRPPLRATPMPDRHIH